MKIQRYSLIDGEMVPSDSGDICFADDVTEIENRHSAVIDNHIHFSTEEFMQLAIFRHTNDSTEQEADIDVIDSVLDQIATKCLGFDDWMQAYHEL
jgi:hypothetical protein